MMQKCQIILVHIKGRNEYLADNPRIQTSSNQSNVKDKLQKIKTTGTRRITPYLYHGMGDFQSTGYRWRNHILCVNHS